MGGEMVRGPDGLQEYTAGLQHVARHLESQIPQRVEGMDATGAVGVVIGADGRPLSFDVADDWRRSLRPGAFAQAVVSAFRAASMKRMRAWLGVLGDVDLPAPSGAGTPASPSVRPPATPGPADRRPRDPNELAQDVLKVAADLDTDTDAPPPQGVGSTAFGKLTLTLTPAQISCTVDEFWVSDKTGEELTAALSAVLSAARANFAEAVARSPIGRAERLLDEAVAALGGPAPFGSFREDNNHG